MCVCVTVDVRVGGCLGYRGGNVTEWSRMISSYDVIENSTHVVYMKLTHAWVAVATDLHHRSTYIGANGFLGVYRA